MTEGSNARGSLDPAELWKQWYETSSRMWAQALEEGKKTYVDTYGLYQSWLKTAGKAQEQMQAKAPEMMNTKEIWNAWFEATVGAWKRAVEMGGDPLGLTTQWLEMMEETRKRIMDGDILPADPFTFFQKWYEATSETWAKVVDDVLGSEKFIESASPFLEIYENFVKTLRHANEEYFSNLQLPTRSDLARVAGLVITLEEKVDKIEDAVENLEEGYAQVATREAMAGLAERLGRLETKLDTLSAALELNEAVETKLDTLSTTLEKSESLVKHLDKVESKLDRVLSVLEKIEARGSQHTDAEIVKSTEAGHRRRPQKKAD